MTTTRSRRLRAAAVLAALTVSAVPAWEAVAAADAGGTGAPAGRGTLKATLDEIVKEGAVGAQAEIRDERGRWTGRSGTARLGSGRPVPAQGRFRVGSTMKSFTATVVLQLAGEGKVSLDDTVGHWLPGLVPGGSGITVRQLLNHTSGLFDYLQSKGMPRSGEDIRRDGFRTYTSEELVRIGVKNPPYFKPGASWMYSNTNYALLGMIIEKATGNTYREEIARRIIKPLGLRDTFLPGASVKIPGPHARGYFPRTVEPVGELIDVTEFNPSFAGAAGEMISTTGDVDRFFAALLGGKLLAPEQLEEMTTVVDISEQTGVPGLGYGLGLEKVRLSCGVTSWGHGGSTPGYATYVGNTRDARRRAVVYATGLTSEKSDAAAKEVVDRALCGA
ncbi:serine hydrolase domain-containing protein [Planomonospora corallina]|uniref:Serine hydrolase domain-containing protein n=1 Tax=Planomonospora corallina TaxID=1806052 RepID=A0ABV8I0Y4_9ACTN